MKETIIAGATIVDPEKDTPYVGSIVLRGGKIDRIIAGVHGDDSVTIIDATGLVAAPGFIDIHAHADGDVACAEKLLAQGVTTAIGGNCGFSPLDVPSFLSGEDEKGFPIHQAEFIGHSVALRKGADLRSPYEAAGLSQLNTMKGLARAALDGGACGISFGIQYAPGTTLAEMRDIAAVAAAYGRLISVHARLNYPNDFDSLRETLDLAKQTGARVLVSHLAYMYADGRMEEALALLAEYRALDLDVWADSGMYTAFQTYAGTPCFDDKHIADYGWRYSNFLAASGRYAGQYLDKERFLDIRTNSPDDSLICFTGVERDIYTALKFPGVILSSDSGATAPGQGHPQGAGNFARFFRVMVRERKDLSLVEAVRKCTLYPALAMNLKFKGRISPGSDADIVLFDPETIRETSDFSGIGNPDSPPEGVSFVFVSGVLAIDRGVRIPGAMAGRAIKY